MYNTRLLAVLFFFVSQSMAQPTRPTDNNPGSRLKTLSQQARQMLIRRQPDSAWRMYLKPALTLLAQLPPTA